MEKLSLGTTGNRAAERAIAGRIAKLSQGQLDCLRLVERHMSSKEIAAELGISPHTVDQRVRGALHILGVERRSQAARLVAGALSPYQRLIHQPSAVEPAGAIGEQGSAIGIQIRHVDRAGGGRAAGPTTEQEPVGSWLPLQLPFATRNQPRNEMSVGARLLWIVLIATGAAFSAGMYLAGLESLSRMLQG